MGKPKIIGSLMLKIPGANDNPAIYRDDFTLLKIKIAIINAMVLPEPPTKV